ncbi:MAG TPA: ribonuclease G, partial [Myxococcota bacterium]|nr:ribonuclease G [Myxococcota bacterium]
MADLLVVNASETETRVAVIENGLVAEVFYERPEDRSVLGNIYKGRVTRVLPGMQAAFVDIGLERAGFLYVTEIFGGGSDFDFYELEEAEEDGAADDVADDAPAAELPGALESAALRVTAPGDGNGGAGGEDAGRAAGGAGDGLGTGEAEAAAAAAIPAEDTASAPGDGAIPEDPDVVAARAAMADMEADEEGVVGEGV